MTICMILKTDIKTFVGHIPSERLSYPMRPQAEWGVKYGAGYVPSSMKPE